MENRDRDKLSRNPNTSTEAGNLKDDSTAEFGQNIGRSENLNEPNRRDENIGSEGMRGDIGRSGSVGSGGGVGEEIESDSDRNIGRDVNLDRDRSETRH